MSFNVFVVFFLAFIIGFSVNATEANKLNFLGESAIQFREDRLRERVNENETSITNLSIAAERKFDSDKFIRLEILGEESRVTNEFNLTVGELFYNQQFDFDNSKFLNFNYTVGFMKLKYGILNPIDGNFAKLPNYYQFLYGLPRGIDVGLAIEKRLTSTLTLGFGGYFGQTVRDSDGFRSESVGVPYNTYLNFKPLKWLEMNAHHYTKEFVNTPEISGIGFDVKTNFKLGPFDLNLNAETWSIDSIAGTAESSGFVYLLNPRVQFKGLYLEGFFTDESWDFDNDSIKVNESFSSYRLGFNISEYFIFETEYLLIENSELTTLKEDALQARVYFNWKM